jgi:hypothetical protein
VHRASLFGFQRDVQLALCGRADAAVARRAAIVAMAS